MRVVRHPMVDRDLVALVDHIVEVTNGDFAAAARRLDEVDELLTAIQDTPHSGVRLSGDLNRWLVRHGGRGQRITIAFRTDTDRDCIFVALVAFGGQDWMAEGKSGRTSVGKGADRNSFTGADWARTGNFDYVTPINAMGRLP
jgi:plasmid stabilization system protein ParE